MSTFTPSIRTPLQTSIEEGWIQVDVLEQRLLENSDDEDLIDQMVDYADLGAAALSRSEQALLEADIEDITQEIADLPAEEAPAEEKPKKKKHSKGFFKRTARKVAHAARDTSRFVRKTGKDLFHSPQNSERRHVSHLSSSASASNRKTGHKVSKFFKKHKKEIIIGAVIAAIVVGGIVIAATTSAAAGSSVAGVGLIGGGGAVNNSQEAPKPAAKPVPKPSDSVMRRIFDPDCVLRDAAFEQAEKKAIEQRYPNLVHPQQTVNEARVRAEAAFEQFKSQLPGIIDMKDTGKAAEISLAVKTALETPTIPGKVLATVVGVVQSTELLTGMGDKIGDLYKPAAEAYRSVYEMEAANREASISRCVGENYQPRLEFHPEGLQVDANRTVMVDKNNPDQNNQITVVMP